MNLQLGIPVAWSRVISPRLSKEDPRRPRDSSDDDNKDEDRLQPPTDWNKAWSVYRKRNQGKKKKTLFSNFAPNKYVSWNPRRSEFPASEEIDPIKKTERSNLKLWTSPNFTLVGSIVVVSFLLIYTILYPLK